MYSKHPVSRTDSAVRARSPPTRIAVLVDNRQVVDEIDLRLCVHCQPLVNEGRHDCNAARRPALDKVSWHFCHRLSVLSLRWTWRPGVRSRVPPNTVVSTSMCGSSEQVLYSQSHTRVEVVRRAGAKMVSMVRCAVVATAETRPLSARVTCQSSRSVLIWLSNNMEARGAQRERSVTLAVHRW